MGDQAVFIEWVQEVFAPSVRQYLREKQLSLRALLVMDEAPAHPPCLEAELSEAHGFITVRFSPPPINPLIQPMGQQVTSDFKKLYTKALFQRCLEVTSETLLTLGEFWEEHFHILACLRLRRSVGGSAFRDPAGGREKLWPTSVAQEPVRVSPGLCGGHCVWAGPWAWRWVVLMWRSWRRAAALS